MTKLQRRLIVLSVAVVLLVGPVVIMGNCSGWNEGSMKVAACAVDFPLARSLADFLYGVVLLSAFLLGIPVLLYAAAAVAVTIGVNRALRRRCVPGTAAAQQRPNTFARWAVPAALTALTAVVAMFLLQVGAGWSSRSERALAFDERCKAAGAQFFASPGEPVESLFHDGNVKVDAYRVRDGRYELAASDYGADANGLIDQGWVRFTEVPLDGGPAGAPTKGIIRYDVNAPHNGRPVNERVSRYGVFSKDLASDADARFGIDGTEITVRDLRTDAAVATLTYFVQPTQSRFCGPVRNGRFDAGEFLASALNLKRQPLQALPSDAKAVRRSPAESVLRLQQGNATQVLALLGETADSRIYLDRKTTVPDGEIRSAWDAENFLKRSPAGVFSMQVRREYDCKQKKYGVLSVWPRSLPLLEGDVVRTLAPTTDWIDTAPGTVGELLFSTVCAA